MLEDTAEENWRTIDLVRSKPWKEIASGRFNEVQDKAIQRQITHWRHSIQQYRNASVETLLVNERSGISRRDLVHFGYLCEPILNLCLSQSIQSFVNAYRLALDDKSRLELGIVSHL